MRRVMIRQAFQNLKSKPTPRWFYLVMDFKDSFFDQTLTDLAQGYAFCSQQNFSCKHIVRNPKGARKIQCFLAWGPAGACKIQLRDLIGRVGGGEGWEGGFLHHFWNGRGGGGNGATIGATNRPSLMSEST